MTPIEVTFALRDFLETALKDFRIEDEAGNESPVMVYLFHLPQQAVALMNAHAEDGYTPLPDAEADEVMKSVYPAVIVRPLTYRAQEVDEMFSFLTVSLTVGVFSRDPANVNGSWAVVNILERIRQALEEKRIFNERCEVVAPITWELYNEELRPLWFGEMMTQWQIVNPIPTYGLTPDEDWQGDGFNFGKGEATDG
ncbi:MAG: hypothetical protein IJU98_02850 [Synergistaceae bacterium]|nr:hypothetical protein [Synergistaceae bacterium]